MRSKSRPTATVVVQFGFEASVVLERVCIDFFGFLPEGIELRYKLVNGLRLREVNAHFDVRAQSPASKICGCDNGRRVIGDEKLRVKVPYETNVRAGMF